MGGWRPAVGGRVGLGEIQEIGGTVAMCMEGVGFLFCEIMQILY